MPRTRIKICGLTRAEDIAAAAAAGADAVGFVCYSGSPRYASVDTLAQLVSHVPAFVSPVLLFVNASANEVQAALRCAPNALLQFHGDEDEAFCASFARPYLRAVRVDESFDLLDCARRFHSANALLLDAPSEAYGGSGSTFDWQRIPVQAARTKPIVLAGGLHSGNVEQAIRLVQPYAVDVSSGVEQARGVKSAEKIHQFIAAVRAADAKHHETLRSS